ncbi:relaxase/mobilization nuclease domain-containing protein [Streptomyces sp. NPDC058618]|uniref:relaxase/mobilization nuclease domain-containing protein n=1 Tax=Streptomyces sp. NPDC058618 TaxID=3346558 RepID=UPI0036574C22
MIAKVTKGARAGGALRYDFGPGHREEHKDARIVAGSVPGTPQQIARIIDRHTRQRADVARPIWRCSLSLPDEDGVLPDEQWARIAEQYVERMWGGAVPWTAVRHDDDHIHLTVSRVAWSGELLSDSHDYARSRPIVRALEREHGLVDAEARSDRVAPQVSGPERAAAQRRGSAQPEREQLRELIRAARDASAGGGRLAFEAALRDAGVDYRANTAKTGRMSGYSFSMPSWTDAGGGQVWAAASRVSRDLRWSQLRETLGQPDPRAQWMLPPQRQAAETVAAPAPADRRQVSAAAARSKSTTTSGTPPRRPPGWSAGTVPGATPYRPGQQPGPRRGRGR